MGAASKIVRSVSRVVLGLVTLKSYLVIFVLLLCSRDHQVHILIGGRFMLGDFPSLNDPAEICYTGADENRF